MIQMERSVGEFHDVGNSIRQIAILLHSLPKRTHRVLLGQLDADEKQRIAGELALLGEVDALEQHRVLKRMHGELHAETSSVEKVESEIQDEIQIGRARVSKKRSGAVYSASETAADAFSEHRDGREHHTGDANQNRANAAPLTGTAAPALASLACQTQADVVTGQAAIHPTTEMLQSMFAQFHQTQAAGVLPTASGDQASAVAANQEMRRHATTTVGDSPQLLPFVDRNDQASASQDADSFSNSRSEAAELAERIDQYLTQMPPHELCRALGMVTTKQAFLVLCGLPNATSETVLDLLPRRQSRKVRSDMRRMGQLQLSEIDAAKQVVAQVAIRMTTQPQSFAA